MVDVFYLNPLIISPNADEALSLLSITLSPTKDLIENAADEFLKMGIGHENTGWIIIRSGALGAYLKSRTSKGRWIDAFWKAGDSEKVVDVTGMKLSSSGFFPVSKSKRRW